MLMNHIIIEEVSGTYLWVDAEDVTDIWEVISDTMVLAVDALDRTFLDWEVSGLSTLSKSIELVRGSCYWLYLTSSSF